MKRLLHIDASPRGGRSHSRRLTGEFIRQWKECHPDDVVIRRDVGYQPPPNIDEKWIAAAFTPAGQRTTDMKAVLKISDELVDQLLAADILLIGVPMYNFGVPAAFKAYIDQIVRVGRTFAFEPEDEAQPYKPLVHGKRAIVIVATGDAGYEEGGRYGALNHVDPYLRTVLGFVGITDVRFVHVGNDEFGGDRLAASLRHARERLTAVVTA